MVKVAYSASRGYFITLPNTINPLPDGFVQAVLNKKTIACTTREILSLSDRAKEAIDQALIATHTILQDELLSNVVRKYMAVLYQLTDSIVSRYVESMYLIYTALAMYLYIITIHVYTQYRLCWICCSHSQQPSPISKQSVI